MSYENRLHLLRQYLGDASFADYDEVSAAACLFWEAKPELAADGAAVRAFMMDYLQLAVEGLPVRELSLVLALALTFHKTLTPDALRLSRLLEEA